MAKIKTDLLYAKTHEWVEIDGDIAIIGITDYAQKSLGAVVYLETAEVNAKLKRSEEFGAIESVKAASDLISPVTGVVVEVNEDAINSPEIINEDAYTNWIIKIKMTNQDELKLLLNANQYEAESK